MSDTLNTLNNSIKEDSPNKRAKIGIGRKEEMYLNDKPGISKMKTQKSKISASS